MAVIVVMVVVVFVHAMAPCKLTPMLAASRGRLKSLLRQRSEVWCYALRTTPQTSAATMPLQLLSFDVFGTLVSVRDSSYGAFERILREAGAPHVDVKAFWEAWEERNIEAYWQPYRPYKQICRDSLAAAFEAFGVCGRAE